MLKLIQNQTAEQIAQHKLDNMKSHWQCRKCKFRWVASLLEMADNPECPRCSK